MKNRCAVRHMLLLAQTQVLQTRVSTVLQHISTSAGTVGVRLRLSPTHAVLTSFTLRSSLELVKEPAQSGQHNASMKCHDNSICMILPKWCRS